MNIFGKTILVLMALLASRALAEPITAQVVGPDDKPLANVPVWARVNDSKATDISYKELQKLSTDDNGQLVINVPEDKDRTNLVRFVVASPDWGLTGGYLKRGENIFHLAPGVAVSGEVKDEAGKPVAGAQVRLGNIYSENSSLSVAIEGTPELEQRYSATTDEKGLWTINGLPSKGQFIFQLSDEKYATVYAQLVLDGAPAPAPVMIAKPGATLIGKIVLPDGKPAAGMSVSSWRLDSYAEDTTGEDGAYKLAGLAAGEAKITISDPSGEWVVAPKSATAVANQTITVPDIAMERGLVLEGIVLDAETGAGLQGAKITAQAANINNTSTASDENGHYRLRVLPGAFTFYFNMMPDGYLTPESNFRQKITIAPGQTELAPISLEKGYMLHGTARDENGNPAVGAGIGTGESWSPDAQTIVGENGEWTLKSVKKEKTAKIIAAGLWQMVEPKTVTLPNNDAIEVVLRPIKLATLEGRAVSPTGEPIAGAKVMVKVRLDDKRGGWRMYSLLTDAQGQFRQPQLRPEQSVELSFDKDGYTFLRGGEVTKEGGAFTATDAILTPQNALLRGQVLDAAGAPIANAQVMARDDNKATARTDATGHFILKDLAAGETMVMAAKGRDFGQAQTQTGEGHEAEIIITLKTTTTPANGVEAAETILRDWAQNGGTRETVSYIAPVLAGYDPDFVLQMGATPHGDVDDPYRLSIIVALSRRDPVKAAQWGVPQLENFKSRATRTEAATAIGLAVADFDPALAKQLLWDSFALINPNEFTFDAGSQYARLAALSAKLQLPEADGIFGAMMQMLGRVQAPKDYAHYAKLLAPMVAAGSTSMAQTVIAKLAPDEQIKALENIIPVVARRDPVGALSLFEKMEALTKLPRPAPVPIAPNAGTYDPTPEQSLARAAAALSKTLAPIDTQAALAVARKITTTGYDYGRPVLIANAARLLPKDAATPVFREAMQAASNPQNTEVMARIAALTYQSQPALGEEFFAETKKALLQPLSRWQEEDMRPSFAPYAFYRAPIDAAESRLLLEAEWEKRGKNVKEDSNASFRLSQIARAMSALDPERALEMARALDDKYGLNWSTVRQIVSYVATPAEERRVMPFEQYNDVWE